MQHATPLSFPCVGLFGWSATAAAADDITHIAWPQALRVEAEAEAARLAAEKAEKDARRARLAAKAAMFGN